MHVLRHKNFPRKKKEDEKKPLQIGSEGEEGEKNQKCVLQMLDYRTPPSPSSFNLFLPGASLCFCSAGRNFAHGDARRGSRC